MSLIKCPKCGEMYSDSYKTCPFCAEDEEFYGSNKKAKNNGRRVEHPKSPSIVGPAMIIIALVLVGFLIYAFVGSGKPAGGDDPSTSDKPVVVEPNEEKDPGKEEPDKKPEKVEIKLNKKSLKLDVGDSVSLKATGAKGYTWTSSDTDVVKVDKKGNVTAQGAGTATVTVTADGANSVACEVTVKEAKKNLELVTEYGASLYSHNEFALNAGEEVDLKIAGTDSTPVWEITKGGSHVTVTQDGVVKGVSAGIANLRITVDGQTIDCRIQCNG